jgi:phosphoribosylaminoimidazole-succinocarboxamide synthase
MEIRYTAQILTYGQFRSIWNLTRPTLSLGFSQAVFYLLPLTNGLWSSGDYDQSLGGASPEMTEKLLYEGKAKKIFLTESEDELLVFYKDDATAFNGAKKGQIESKGQLNNAISSVFFELLETAGVRSHFLKKTGSNTMLVKKLEIIPLEVVVRNIAAGSLSQRLGWPEGRVLDEPIVEFYYKDDALGDPLINNNHIAALKLASPCDLAFLEEEAKKIDRILSAYLLARRVRLVDFKLEFGRHKGQILLGDEISPDTCRFWDAETNKKLDKDRFRQDLGEVTEAYQEIYNRLTCQAVQKYRALVKVRLKDSVLDPQGEAILRSLSSLGLEDFQSIRVGKLIDISVVGENEREVSHKVKKLSDDLLANPNMEKYSFTVEPVK